MLERKWRMFITRGAWIGIIYQYYI